MKKGTNARRRTVVELPEPGPPAAEELLRRAREAANLGQQTLARTIAIRIAVAAAIVEFSKTDAALAERILSRMDRALAALEQEHPSIGAVVSPHVGELKSLILNPPE